MFMIGMMNINITHSSQDKKSLVRQSKESHDKESKAKVSLEEVR